MRSFPAWWQGKQWLTHNQQTVVSSRHLLNHQNRFEIFIKKDSLLRVNPLSTEPQIGQTHSNNLSAVANELFECAWTFSGVGTWRVKLTNLIW